MVQKARLSCPSYRGCGNALLREGCGKGVLERRAHKPVTVLQNVEWEAADAAKRDQVCIVDRSRGPQTRMPLRGAVMDWHDLWSRRSTSVSPAWGWASTRQRNDAFLFVLVALNRECTSWPRRSDIGLAARHASGAFRISAAGQPCGRLSDLKQEFDRQHDICPARLYPTLCPQHRFFGCQAEQMTAQV